jgi:hypothetical protein
MPCAHRTRALRQSVMSSHPAPPPGTGRSPSSGDSQASDKRMQPTRRRLAIRLAVTFTFGLPLALSPAGGTDRCAMDSINVGCDWSLPCYDGRGNRYTAHECNGTSNGPCSRDSTNPDAYIVTGQTPYVTIPVVFHMIKHETSGEGSIPLSRFSSQVLAFNQDFNVRPHGIPGFQEPAGPSAHIEFALAGIDFVSTTSWYRMQAVACSPESEPGRMRV